MRRWTDALIVVLVTVVVVAIAYVPATKRKSSSGLQDNRRGVHMRARRLLALVIALGLGIGMVALFALSSLSPAVCAVVRVAENKYDRGLPMPPPVCADEGSTP